MSKNIKSKILILISIVIAMCLTIICLPNEVKAMGRWQGNMPSNSFNPTTGMFPQILNNRTVTLPSNRFSFNTANWSANITSGTVYCADQGKMLRFGKYDPKTYYFNDVSSMAKSYNEYKQEAIDSSKYLAIQELQTSEYSRSEISGVNAIEHFSGVNAGKYAMVTKGGFQSLNANAKLIMDRIMSTINEGVKPTPYSKDIDSIKTYGEWDGSPEYGPKVAVMENTDKASDGYATTKTGTFSSSRDDISKQAAYILTALNNEVYAQDGNYSKKYSEEDLQTAYWMLVDPNGIGSLTKLTENGKALYPKAIEYNNFTKEISNGYKASINSSDAQVIVNQETKEYIIGPFTANYPDYQDISYIKSMYLTTNTGSTLIVDESHSDFEIIVGAGTAVPGSNGITKKYPKGGEKFFIKFSAEKTNYPTSVSVGAKFEYLDYCTINYQQLTTNAHIYQYIGYCKLAGDHTMPGGTLEIKVSVALYKMKTDTWTTKEHRSFCEAPVGDFSCCGGKTVEHSRTYEVYAGTKTYTDYWYVRQPYVKMSDSYESDIPQPLTATTDGRRDYKIVEASASIDLTMELGGKVFVDNTGGKEDIANGTYSSNDQDIPMSNVVVTLYRADSIYSTDGINDTVIGRTLTDANGDYNFTGLNSMFKYYVQFTYNGQYYEPTVYKAANTNWATNSKGTDRRQDRISYNARFETINSSPTSYATTATYNTWLEQGSDGKVYNTTYSKDELWGKTLDSNGNSSQTTYAVIDNFGNLYSDGTQVRDVNGKLVSIEQIQSTEIKNKLKSMIQFVKDSFMNSYTYKPQNMNDATNVNGTMDLYPIYNQFVIDVVQYPSSLTPNVNVLYDNNRHINQGYNERQKSDLAVKKDVEKVTLEINGQEHIYTYDTLENKENAENTWDINLRLSDAVSNQKYYDTNYSRELYTADYLYKVSNYGENFADYGKAKSDELEVYITYKIMVRNQAMSIQARVDELVDYYDKDLEYIDARSYIEIKRGENAGKYATQASTSSRYASISQNTITSIDGYDTLYIRGLSKGAQLVDESGNPSGNVLTDGIYLEGGQTAYVYLTFKVKKENKEGEDWIRLDEELETAKAIGVGKENIVELNGYSTRYAKGTIVPNAGDVSYTAAGIIDRDSKPGNLNAQDVPKDGQIKHENFEDDTDKAPNIRIILNRDDNAVRVISGTVFEDERTESIGVTTTGDGIRDNKDKTLINGVTVQLVELMENGTEFIWRTFENGSGTAASTKPIINGYNLVSDYTFGNDHNGQYAFKSFMPGKYIVRFIYGDTVKTVTPASLNMGGLNEKSYNGQDFKSTTYQEGIEQNKVYTWRANSTWVNGQENLGKILTEVSTFKADASNNETANAKTNELKAYLYDITASDKLNNVSDAKDIESRRNEVIDYSDNDVTNYIAEVLASHKTDYSTMNDRNQLLNDLMANTQMTAETGLMVIEFEYDAPGTDGNKKDNTYKIQNVDLGLEERAKAQLAIDKEVTNVKVTLADGSILFDAKNTASNVLWRDHKAYNEGLSEGKMSVYKGNFMDEKAFGSIENIRNSNANKFGLIQLSMDEELMHGATMEITYQVTVENVGEVDYKDNLFYYTGNKSANAQVVTTRADKVIDLVLNLYLSLLFV